MNRASQENRIPHPASALLLVGMLILMLFNNLHKKLSYDEPNNLRYGYRLITEGPMAPMEGQRMPVLALHALACASFNCDIGILQESELARAAVRLPSMIFALAAGLLLYLWLIPLAGSGAAMAGLALYAFNPNFIAHGKELTSDSATVFFTLLTIYLFWKLLTSGLKRYLPATALAFALGVLSKFSILVLLPVLAALFLIHLFSTKQKFKPVAFALGTLVFGIIVWGAINSAYLFQGSFLKASDYKWQSRAYQKYQNLDLPVPFPKVFTEGLDYTKYLEENPHEGRGNNYILGKLHRKGRWYSFPVMVLLKTPLAFFLLLLLAIRKKKQDWLTAAWVWVPFLGWIIIFSIACDAQLGIRYVLPALTFPILAAAQAFTHPVTRLRRALLFVLTAWYILSLLSYGPHMMSYFNEAIGSRINAWKYLADSNLDWEDKQFFTDRFIEAHPEMAPIHVRPMEPVTGYIIAPANDLVGVLDEHRFDWLRLNYKPLRHITYSHYLYHVPEKENP